MTMLSQQTIPVFRIFDVAKAKEFYVDWLGFGVDWEHRFGDGAPVYMQVSREGLVIHLTEHHGDCCPGSKAFVHTDRVEELHRELAAKEYKYNRPGLEAAPWGAVCFEVIDPFGNKILFNRSANEGG